MKKLLSILLAVSMLFTLGTAAMASGDPSGSAPAGGLKEESVADMKVSSYGTLTANSSRSSTDEGHLYVGYDIVDGKLTAESNWSGDPANITLNNSVTGEGFTAVRANNSNVNITGTLKTSSGGASGEFASDFTGTGVAVLVNEGSRVTATDVDFESDGFVRDFAMVYGGSDEPTSLTVEDSHIVAYGADPFQDSWDGYYNSAQTTMMLSSPWVLGIQGGIRTINVLGNQPTFIAKDSYIGSGGWAVVSTDGCTAPVLWIMDSTLEILGASEGGMNAGAAILGYDDVYGSGYGSFLIGSSIEHFYGTTFEGATYASILNGGEADYNGLKKGQTYELTDAMTGEVIDTYTTAEDVPTVINTVFAVTAQNSGSVTVNEGVEINAEEAAFIYRSGTSDWTIDGAEVNVSSGVILQMADNDDPMVGGFNPFGTYLNEDAGIKTEAYTDSTTYTFTTDSKVDPSKTYYEREGNDYVVVQNPTDLGTVAYYEKSTGGASATLNLKNGKYDGDVFNGTGYYDQAPDALYVNIASDALLTGDIALTSAFHGISLAGRDVDQVVAAIDVQNASHKDIGGYYEGLEDIEYEFLDKDFKACDKAQAAYIHFTKFCIAEYFLMGQMENARNYNGMSTADVTVEGIWVVASESLVTYLKVAPGATVYGELVENADGSITILPSAKTIPAGEYGSAFAPAEASSSSGEASGEAS